MLSTNQTLGKSNSRNDGPRWPKTEEAQSQSQKKTAQETTSASMEKPEPMTETTRTAQKPEETGQMDTKPQKI